MTQDLGVTPSGPGSHPTGQALLHGLGASRVDPSRKPFVPQPNHHTKATFEDVIAWASAVAEGEWTWARNGQCKYVTIRLDSRAGAYSLQDRDGNEISLAALVWQYRRDRDGNPEGQDREAGLGAKHDSPVPERQSPTP